MEVTAFRYWENGHEIWYVDIRSLTRAGSLMTVAKEISKYK
jgi:hypothetical protein